MKRLPALLSAALGLALLVTACETDSASSRIKEKPAVYASLKPWQKKYIDKGVIAVGFTPDMVYLAVGKASKVAQQESPDGPLEVWTYRNYYPTADANNMRYNQTGESLNNPGRLESNGSGGLRPRGAGRSPTSISTTGGVQGGSGEPADLQAYTLVVTFKDGVVKQMKIDPN